jgi:hypothetical protein
MKTEIVTDLKIVAVLGQDGLTVLSPEAAQWAAAFDEDEDDDGDEDEDEDDEDEDDDPVADAEDDSDGRFARYWRNPYYQC